MQTYTPIQGGILYAENSRVFKKQGTDSPSELITLSFEPTQISANSDGSLLAVASKNAVEVWLLETSSDSARNITDYDKNKLTFSSDIVALKWHPCARANAGLVVLTTSQLISIYLPPGQPIILERIDLRDSSDLALDPVGFGFGAEESPLGCLTLYLGTSDGDIYKIFPYLPPEVEFQTEALSKIRQFVGLEGWQSELESWSDSKHSKVTILKRKAERLLRTVNSEPLRLNPYPSELYEDNTLDVCTGSVGWATDIVVQASEKHVTFYALTSPLSDTLVTVASVRFANPQTHRRIDLISSRWVFITCDNVTHIFDVSEWTSQLHEALAADDGSISPKIGKSSTHVTAHPPVRIYRTMRAIAAVDSNETWPLTHPSSETDKLTDQATKGTEIADSSFSSYLDLGLQSKINASLTDILAGGPTAPFASNWGANLGSLDKLNSLARDYNKKIIRLARLLAQLQLQRQAQRRESIQQFSDINQLKWKTEKTSTNIPELNEKIQKAAERQTNLYNRLRSISEKAGELERKKPVHAPSKAEEAWFTDLKSSLPRKLDGLNPQVEQLHQSLAAVKHARTSDDERAAEPSSAALTAGQTIELHWRLKNQENLVTSLKSKLALK